MKIILTETEFREYINQLLVEVFNPVPLQDRVPEDERLFNISQDIIRYISEKNEMYRKNIDSYLTEFEKNPSRETAIKIIQELGKLNIEGTIKNKLLQGFSFKNKRGDDLQGDRKYLTPAVTSICNKLYQYKLDYIEKFCEAIQRHDVGITAAVADDENGKRAIYFIDKNKYEGDTKTKSQNRNGLHLYKIRLGATDEIDGTGALHFPVNISDLNQHGIIVPTPLKQLNGDNMNYIYDTKNKNYKLNTSKKDSKQQSITDANIKYANCEIIPLDGFYNSKGQQYGAIMQKTVVKDNVKNIFYALVKGSNDRRPIDNRWFDDYVYDEKTKTHNLFIKNGTAYAHYVVKPKQGKKSAIPEIEYCGIFEGIKRRNLKKILF